MGKQSGSGRINRVVSGAALQNRAAAGSNWNAVTPATILVGEASIRSNSFETAIVYGANGNLISSTKGQAHSVSVGYIPKDSIVTHNHPSGASFSKNDLITASNVNLTEIRAVGKKYTYSVKRNGADWGERGKFIRAYSNAEIRTRYKLEDYIRRGAMISDAERQKRIRDANMLHSHLIMKSVAGEMGWEYRKASV